MQNLVWEELKQYYTQEAMTVYYGTTCEFPQCCGLCKIINNYRILQHKKGKKCDLIRSKSTYQGVSVAKLGTYKTLEEAKQAAQDDTKQFINFKENQNG